MVPWVYATVLAIAGCSDSSADTSGEASSGRPPPMCDPPRTLGEAGDCRGRRIGVGLAASRLSDELYANAAREFNAVTAENEMKWGNNERSPGRFDFRAGDQIVDFALEHGMQIKGHALVWHNQLPGWVNNLTDEASVRAAMLTHIEEVMAHYRGKVYAWDVVNEAWNDDGSAMRDSIFFRTLGPGYVDEAFIAARAADPDAKLYYNDFDAENLSVKSDAVYEMVKGMLERGVPIDGVGLQMHVRIPDNEPSIDELIQNMQRIADLGLEVVVSEIDVRLCNGETQEQQAARYHDIVRVCLAQPGCTEVTVWGVGDADSWLNAASAPGCPDGETPYPLLWDDAYQKKPTYHAFMDALIHG